jgi:hypothetical protein
MQILTLKGLINLALAYPEEFFKQHLIKTEEQPSFWKLKYYQLRSFSHELFYPTYSSLSALS